MQSHYSVHRRFDLDRGYSEKTNREPTSITRVTVHIQPKKDCDFSLNMSPNSALQSQKSGTLMKISPVDSQDFHMAKTDFDRTKAGVKGLLDSGLLKIPKIFVHPPENLQNNASQDFIDQKIEVPVIDLKGFEGVNRAKTVAAIREASEVWGIFQLVNHGISFGVLEEVIDGIQRFHEQTREVKMEWYSREHVQPVRFYSNGDLYVSKAVNWRDSISCHYADGLLDPNALPQVCRVAIKNYMEKIMKLKDTLVELISEALGLDTDYLTNIDCMKTATLVCHYYPTCPQPDLTLGATKHSDPSFLTILLQDSIGGLQVLQHNQWVDVKPVKGALIVNIGDLMQLITNDKFKSVEHRVLAAPVGPRISAACFFYPSTANSSTPYGPIKELLSEVAAPKYRQTDLKEYMAHYRSKGLDGISSLSFFKV
ncbi:1-aminocyclopropane-1-carboxylate oxidase homolog 1-like isoform X1 [Rutidosis leptorrhynchoides]|uniref:1-aminocyclopropane-1-carboxylate oxidase homolog 1-like isoform X1 n=1 Tax=Rutidosis leptorrhynchoides TaxID=125765 RepID=UPI003A9A29B8